MKSMSVGFILSAILPSAAGDVTWLLQDIGSALQLSGGWQVAVIVCAVDTKFYRGVYMDMEKGVAIVPPVSVRYGFKE